MIKIISKPKMKKCEECGCEFTYEDEDTIRNTITNFTNPYYGYTSVKIRCPQCNNKIYLGEDVDWELREKKLNYDYEQKKKRKGWFDIW